MFQSRVLPYPVGYEGLVSLETQDSLSDQRVYGLKHIN